MTTSVASSDDTYLNKMELAYKDGKVNKGKFSKGLKKEKKECHQKKPHIINLSQGMKDSYHNSYIISIKLVINIAPETFSQFPTFRYIVFIPFPQDLKS